MLIQQLSLQCQSLLVKTRGPDRSDIVRFAFTFGRLAQLHLRNFHTKVRGVSYQVDSAVLPMRNR